MSKSFTNKMCNSESQPSPPLPREPATRASWKNLPPPEIRANLGFTEAYSYSDFELIKRGLVPQEMEDKWFVFYEDPWLYFHRSWTGACIYAARFNPSGVGFTVDESWVSRDSNHYKETNIDYDRSILKFLIDTFILNRPGNPPVPNDLPALTAIHHHHLFGSAPPEQMQSAEPHHCRSWWTRIVNWLEKVPHP